MLVIGYWVLDIRLLPTGSQYPIPKQTHHIKELSSCPIGSTSECTRFFWQFQMGRVDYGVVCDLVEGQFQ